jgi:uncharacterized protein YbaR (Trm112 family)
MHVELLDILRCPFCGGTLTLDASEWHQQERDEIQGGILACHCCTFPVIAGIPVMHLADSVTVAADHVRAGRPELARQVICATEQPQRFDEIVSSPDSTYRDAVAALVPEFEAAYFLHRFSDPTFVVAHALARAVAATVLRKGGRTLDVCGGSGHLTRSLMDISSPPPVVADLYFAKLWLARRFTAPGCEAVCCDANGPLPFARNAFRFAMCTDAFMFIWTKRQLVGEMMRAIDDGRHGGAALISHAHNELRWSPSHGQPLTPKGYRQLFETIAPRVFAESELLTDVVNGGPLDLSRRDGDDRLDIDPALVLIATESAEVFAPHDLEPAAGLSGELRLNPLYAAESEGNLVRLRLQFPSAHYAEEFSACRQYLPESVVVSQGALEAVADGRLTREVADLARLRVVLDLPRRYY